MKSLKLNKRIVLLSIIFTLLSIIFYSHAWEIEDKCAQIESEQASGVLLKHDHRIFLPLRKVYHDCEPITLDLVAVEWLYLVILPFFTWYILLLLFNNKFSITPEQIPGYKYIRNRETRFLLTLMMTLAWFIFIISSNNPIYTTCCGFGYEGPIYTGTDYSFLYLFGERDWCMDTSFKEVMFLNMIPTVIPFTFLYIFFSLPLIVLGIFRFISDLPVLLGKLTSRLQNKKK